MTDRELADQPISPQCRAGRLAEFSARAFERPVLPAQRMLAAAVAQLV